MLASDWGDCVFEAQVHSKKLQPSVPYSLAHSRGNMQIHNIATGLQGENKIATYIYTATTMGDK